MYIDENGDAAGNYTVLARGLTRNHRNRTVGGLVPVGTFRQSMKYIDRLPVSSITKFTYFSSRKSKDFFSDFSIFRYRI